MKIIAIPVLLALLYGCATTATKIDTAQLSELRKGQTTVAEVMKKFGRPNVLSKNWDGTQTAAYSTADGSADDAGLLPAVGAVMMGGSSSGDAVVFYFDAKGVLTDYKATPTSSAAAPSATAPAGQAAGDTPAAKGATASAPAKAAAPARKRGDGLPFWMPSEVRDTRQ